jgi:tetratricopeptide (TPR) repeat protein
MLRVPLLLSMLFLACVCCQNGRAQAAENPMLTAYRACTAAIQRGDNIEAELQAERALSAADATSSDKRGILAVNLALTRLRLGKRVEAIAPANRAAEFLGQGDSGLDAELVRLVQARSQLDVNKVKSLNLLMTAIDAAVAGNVDTDDVYAAAIDLGGRAFEAKDYRMAIRAWGAARAHAIDGIDKIEALRGEGIANIYLEKAEQGIPLLDEALTLMVPLLQTKRTEWTRADILFNQIRAWRSVGVSSLPEAQRKQFENSSLPDTSKRDEATCPFKLNPVPFPRYPRSQYENFSIASLVLGYDSNEDGTITNVTILASAPAVEAFSQSILKVAPLWRIEKTKNAPTDCTLAQKHIDSLVSFRLAEQ